MQDTSLPPSDPSSNRAFLLRFAVVVVILHVVVGGFALIAGLISNEAPEEEVVRALLLERVAPVGKVATSEDQIIRVAQADVSAQDETLTGEQVVTQFCGSCHTPGILNAPKSHDAAAWQAHAAEAGGDEGLLQNAINGKNQMPPRGGFPQLTDDQLRDAIAFMRQPAP